MGRSLIQAEQHPANASMMVTIMRCGGQTTRLKTTRLKTRPWALQSTGTVRPPAAHLLLWQPCFSGTRAGGGAIGRDVQTARS